VADKHVGTHGNKYSNVKYKHKYKYYITGKWKTKRKNIELFLTIFVLILSSIIDNDGIM